MVADVDLVGHAYSAIGTSLLRHVIVRAVAATVAEAPQSHPHTHTHTPRSGVLARRCLFGVVAAEQPPCPGLLGVRLLVHLGGWWRRGRGGRLCR